MRDEEVGRWDCEKCGRVVVAAGQLKRSFSGFGAFSGPCPWECGAWISRSFRLIRPGAVKAFRADDWDAARRSPDPGASA
jgi:hypothetical protein